MTRIAIVGMACRYPDATSPGELWDNVLAGRRAFRRLPDERTRPADYFDPDPAVPDRFYADTAAVLDGFDFDRLAYRVPGSTFRSTDLTHWLALDTAARALADAGFTDGAGLPRDRTGVIVGNSLTGEFTRASQLRLRWPYVHRTTAAALRDEGWGDERITAFLTTLEARFKQPFPPIDEDSLAGALSNTIAGRICNHFDLGGGGYTVDGACSSSLLSVITAARALTAGELDVAVAGGVDLSLDPFELVGFAKTGALATGEMRVYDRDSGGFWPGEGCGMVVLMREDDVRAAGVRGYATVAGWGVSSDGRGGITRPEQAGYLRALDRAYQSAGFGTDTVDLFEGHGTGTAVGDGNEVRALSAARAARPGVPAAALGSIKALIGHTKAAAGVAGLIKATLAVHRRLLPPTAGCVTPLPELTGAGAPLRVLDGPEAWPAGRPVRAGVSAMGFGGINTHVVLDGGEAAGPSTPAGRGVAADGLRQDVELLLVRADSADRLAARLDELAAVAGQASYAEITDLAAQLDREMTAGPWRAAVVVAAPAAARDALADLAVRLRDGVTGVFDPARRMFAGRVGGPARIGLLFPGQGTGGGLGGRLLRHRFPRADAIYRRVTLPPGADPVATEHAQPRIVAGSLAGLSVLATAGVDARIAAGHSLGELSALHWAGAMDDATLLRVAAARGAIMAEHAAGGAMAGIAAPAEVAEPLLAGEPVVVAGFNGPRQTVVAGPAEALRRVGDRAAREGQPFTRLPVSHAFHSPLMEPAAPRLEAFLREQRFTPLARPVASTVTGTILDPATDLPALLRRQVTDPVRFIRAVTLAAAEVDLFIEVGAGRTLTRLVREITPTPVVAMDTDSASLAGVLTALAAAYVHGADLRPGALTGDRLTRPLRTGPGRFLANPVEAAPDLAVPAAAPAAPGTPPVPDGADHLDLLRRLLADRAELPLDAVGPDSHPLDDLHLSSITVGQVVTEAAQALGLDGVRAPVNFATASLTEIAAALSELAETGRETESPSPIAGAADWTRAFTVDLDPVPVPAIARPEENGPWQVFADPDDPLAALLKPALEQGGIGAGVLITAGEPAPAVSGAVASATRGSGRLLLVRQDGEPGIAAAARTLWQEHPAVRVTVLHVPATTPDTVIVRWAVTETAATTGFSEVHYDADGQRRVPTLRALPIPERPSGSALHERDVLLVTGGGKGITAECALALADGTGAGLALLGRSDPESDPELRANLDRMRASGVRVRYLRADVTDPDAVRAAVTAAEEALGAITAILHGAGVNEPAALARLDADRFRAALAPKVDGLGHVLAAVAARPPRLLITFGSVIGRFGLRGEAHYAVANDLLARRTADYARANPGCRALCVEWSVWSGVGMGERLSVVESLLRAGITPISPDRGVAMLRALLADPATPPVVVVTGRAEATGTIRRERPELPLWRFLERELVRYHGVELVTEVTLSPAADPYLLDHKFDGNLLFPAVLGLEAMAQVALATLGATGVPAFSGVRLSRPVVVAPGAGTTIRIAAVVTGTDQVSVVLRSAETGYAADHFSAVITLGAGDPRPSNAPLENARAGDLSLENVPLAAGPDAPIDVRADLYDAILFQSGRFRRLRRYRRAAARQVDVRVGAGETAGWFGPFQPAPLVLGDPGARDALMHGLQVCVPDATLLPVGVDRIVTRGPAGLDGDLDVTAVERDQHGDLYLYDVIARSADGTVVERWDGLRLMAVRTGGPPRSLPAPLFGPLLERAAGDRLGLDLAVALRPDAGGARRAVTALALAQALGRPVTVRYRPDGRPEIGAESVSAAHAAGLTLAVAAHTTVACDLEPVVARADWDRLLGPLLPVARRLAADTGEPPQTAATRVWCAMECLQKAGLAVHGPLTVRDAGAGGWVTLASAGVRVVTLAAPVRSLGAPMVFAILAKEG